MIKIIVTVRLRVSVRCHYGTTLNILTRALDTVHGTKPKLVNEFVTFFRATSTQYNPMQVLKYFDFIKDLRALLMRFEIETRIFYMRF